MNKKKIAVLGGSFDPIHKGHLQIAKQAVAMGMDEVWFMPTYDTPLKDRNLTHSTHRLEMIKRAIGAVSSFSLLLYRNRARGKVVYDRYGAYFETRISGCRFLLADRQ